MKNVLRLITALTLATTAIRPAAAHIGMEEEFFFADIGEMPGLLTMIGRDRVPVTVTTITADDIRLASARNLLDVMETYVPGFRWLLGDEARSLSLRGFVDARNLKFLLLVNGVEMGQRGHVGVVTELENWDMDDVEKVEVIRGPGSVTYGPGAVAGVIHIVTKDGNTARGARAGVFHVNRYSASGTRFSLGRQAGGGTLYLHGSVTRTAGFMPRQFVTNNAGVNARADYMGSGRFTGTNARNQPALDYMGDYDDEPQVKTHLQFNGPSWKVWARYTKAGSARPTPSQAMAPMVQGGEMKNVKAAQEQQAAVTAEHSLKGGIAEWRNSFGGDSISHRRRFQPGRNALNPEPNHVNNMLQQFSETDLFFKSLLNLTFSPQYKLALGAKYTWQKYGAPWGESRDKLLMGENPLFGGDTILSGPDALYLRETISVPGSGPFSRSPFTYYVGNGWTSNNLAMFGEMNLGFADPFTLILSARADKSKFTSTLFSPRAAVVSDLGGAGIFVLSAQRSLRANTETQLFVLNKGGQKGDSERTDNLELKHVLSAGDGKTLETSAFYSDTHILSFVFPANRVTHKGDLSLVGLEAELRKTTPQATYGINHAFVKQLRFHLAAGQTSDGTTSSDVLVNGVNAGVGNDLQNYSNHITKAFARMKVGDRWAMQASARAFWAMKGNEDYLEVTRRRASNAVNRQGTDLQIANLRSKHAFGADVRLDAAVERRIGKSASVLLAVQNLWGLNENPRHIPVGSIGTDLSNKVSYVEEPTSVSLRLDYGF